MIKSTMPPLKRKPTKTPKETIYLRGGPFDGKKLRVSATSNRTTQFAANGRKGFYENTMRGNYVEGRKAFRAFDWQEVR